MPPAARDASNGLIFSETTCFAANGITTLTDMRLFKKPSRHVSQNADKGLRRKKNFQKKPSPRASVSAPPTFC